MFELLTNLSQGWYLTTLSSILCALGTLVIFLDDIYYCLLPKWITSRHPFNLKDNYSFMNGSLAFSSGCLLFTALYRLLPEALDNLNTKKNPHNSNVDLIFSFIAGILACFVFNQALHVLTSESVVHCSHDGEDHVESLPYSDLVNAQNGHHNSSHSHSHLPSYHDHSHSHSHDQDHHHDHDHDQDQDHHDHSHSHGHSSLSSSNSHIQQPAPYDATVASGGSHTHGGSEDIELYDDEADGPNSANPERAPLLAHRKSLGLLHYFANLEENDRLLGECKGYSSAEACLHAKDKLHFCELPQLPEELAGHGTQRSSDSSESVRSKELTNSTIAKSRGDLSALEAHSHHVRSEHHHHHVNSPLSRLLLIGVQTMLAITLHKFPEGFITYITSETNPDLGVSIFLSLLIHNFTEGFSMCLPLYYSFASKGRWSKLKAVSISGFLGGFSQPLGALMGLLFMKANHADSDKIDLDKLNYLFGITIAVTSGFLSVIALSMYGSAVSFSGSSNFVMVWCIIGMCTIGLSTAFLN